jgi:hypothetical protein
MDDLAALPVAEDFLHAFEGFLGGDVADDGQNCVIGHEVLAMVGNQVVASDRRQRLRRSALRQAVRMKSVDQPIENGVGNKSRILEVHLQRRQGLPALSLDLFRRKRRVARHIGQQPQTGIEAVLHDDDVDEVRSVPAPAPISPPMKSMRSFISFAVRVVVP